MISKLLAYLPKNLAGILGIIQAILKTIKEILTALGNLTFLPQDKIDKIRAVVNGVDNCVETIKNFLLGVGV